MSKVTRRKVCVGLAAVPATVAVATIPGQSAGPVTKTTQANTAPDIIARIIGTVSEHEGVSAEIMLSPLRTREAVTARRKALYLAFRISGKSLPEIGRRFGGRDHTTVLHAVRATETLASADQVFQAELTYLARAVDRNADELIAASESRFARYA